MRIVAGKYKNKQIPTVKGSDYRPSTSKLREAIFSILSSGEFLEQELFKFDNNTTNILDIFCGTGALGFEGLSRGAAKAIFVDIDNFHLQKARQFASDIGRDADVIFLNLNALNLKGANLREKSNLVFIDPPYNKGLVNKILYTLTKNYIVEDGGVIVVEAAKREIIDDCPSLSLVKEKIYGNNSKLLIFRYKHAGGQDHEQK